MAIKLEVQPYCENCTIFKADVDQPTKCYGDGMVFYQTDTIVRCSRRNLCAGLIRHFKKEMQKGETNAND